MSIGNKTFLNIGEKIEALLALVQRKAGQGGMDRAERVLNEIPEVLVHQQVSPLANAIARAEHGDSKLATMAPKTFRNIAAPTFFEPQSHDARVVEELQTILRGEPLYRNSALAPLRDDHHSLVEGVDNYLGDPGFTTPPTLWMHEPYHGIVQAGGHEGRHRAKAIAQEDFDRMLVELRALTESTPLPAFNPTDIVYSQPGIIMNRYGFDPKPDRSVRERNLGALSDLMKIIPAAGGAAVLMDPEEAEAAYSPEELREVLRYAQQLPPDQRNEEAIAAIEQDLIQATADQMADARRGHEDERMTHRGAFQDPTVPLREAVDATGQFVREAAGEEMPWIQAAPGGLAGYWAMGEGLPSHLWANKGRIARALGRYGGGLAGLGLLASALTPTPANANEDEWLRQYGYSAERAEQNDDERAE